MEKLEYKENGVVVLKTSLNENLSFKEISKNIYKDLNIEVNRPEIKKFSGYLMGNLNVYPGTYGYQILKLLKSEKKILSEIEDILGNKIENFDISFGGNLSLPKKGKQLFHTDGKIDDEMNLVSIVTEKIDENNGPTEVCLKSHLKDYTFSKFFFSKKNKKKLYGEIGDIIIRKHNLWHRGTTNFSSNPRFLLSLFFFPKNSLNQKDFEKTKELKIYPNFFKNNFMGKFHEFIYVKLGLIIVLIKVALSVIKDLLKTKS